MAEQRITANGTLDVLTAHELRDVLRSWQTELTRGARLRRWAIQGQVDAAGVLLIGNQDDGPAEGMAWAITRLSVTVSAGAGVPVGGLQVYANDINSPAALLVANLSTDVYPNDHGCNLLSGDSLRITGSGMIAGAQVTVAMSIKEVPIQMVWSL
jgi:hypothetical protein